VAFLAFTAARLWPVSSPESGFSGMTCSAEFWDALAPHHASIENNYLDVASLHGILADIRPPALVVGAGQGLIVAELRKAGIPCDGVDWSAVMIRYAKTRRDLALVQADARALPFEAGSYRTIIYATGVIDFMDDEEGIRAILNEGRRIISDSGTIFVAFYRLSPSQETFLTQVGLLRDNLLFHRETLELYLLSPVQMVVWVARKAKVSYFRAAARLLLVFALSTMREKVMTFNMQRIFRELSNARALIHTAAEKQPYRNGPEIQKLFARIGISIQRLQTFHSCHIVQIQP
jgi:ubiquinone/menaquinone biosynthesis C-methylase UbiE